MALMDPYGLTLFPVEWWGVVLGITATGFIIGGAVVAKFGLGRNPIRTMLLFVIVMGLLGSLFTIREFWWLYALGIWLYMCIIPVIEASEQTVIQKVVPYQTQGRVFGFAQAFEASAAPITAFLIAPIAQFWIIPYMETDAGQQTWGWLLGEGEARGIALVFFVAGLVMVVLALLAFTTRAYRTLSAEYDGSPRPGEAGGSGAPRRRSMTGRRGLRDDQVHPEVRHRLARGIPQLHGGPRRAGGRALGGRSGDRDGAGAPVTVPETAKVAAPVGATTTGVSVPPVRFSTLTVVEDFLPAPLGTLPKLTLTATAAPWRRRRPGHRAGRRR